VPRRGGVGETKGLGEFDHRHPGQTVIIGRFEIRPFR
jgi:hypothetical protein